MLITGAFDSCSLCAQLDAGCRVITTCRGPIERIRWLEDFEQDVRNDGSLGIAVGQVERIIGGIPDVLNNGLILTLIVSQPLLNLG